MPRMNHIQWEFAQDVALLIGEARRMGVMLTFGEAWRPQVLQDMYLKGKASKVKHSRHQDRLAVDLNLFVGGQWKPYFCTEWAELGRFWESIRPENRWGGNWDGDASPGETGEDDFNHFERVP